VNLIRRDMRWLFGKFVSNWRQFLAIHVAVNVLVFVFLAPAATLLLSLAWPYRCQVMRHCLTRTLCTSFSAR